MTSVKQNTKLKKQLPKAPTGIQGLDEITGGGLPKGRPTLAAGPAGSGKTLLAMQFLVNGALQYNEPGVFLAFEESAEELAQNVASLGIDLKDLIKRKKLLIDAVRMDRSEVEETGEFDLDGLFIRLGNSIDSIGAKRVVLDTMEVLFSSLANHGILRAEMRRLLDWLKSKGVTAIVTAERGNNSMTRFGFEEYVADCVITLDHRVIDQISTRRLRVVKYRGTLHGTNEYPFLIGRHGISVLPITSLGLNHKVPSGRISSGVVELDEMLGGKGFHRGSTILVSGTAGTGKSSLAAAFVDAACRRGERCLYFAFEESPNQILRNMRSIGIDLAPHVKNGLLQFHASRSTVQGLEMHLLTIYDLTRAYKPRIVVLDPISDLSAVGSPMDVKATFTRIIDFLKTNEITSLFTNYATETNVGQSIIGISSLIDTWISLRNLESMGERNRGLFILKSRGMAHSHQIRSFLLTNRGIKLGLLDLSRYQSVPGES